ncbi:CHAT domain-containing protein [Amphritea sp.]|uniref:CHAT domain-containing protein n=1 Tax=Amphritea sp. TaxID=1872502 RepID=UPI0025C71764|nr:CHAT domain-containing protein [Amphritea sp.]
MLVDLKGDQSDAAVSLWIEANQRNNNVYFACDKIVELYAYKRHDYTQGKQSFHECLSGDESTVGLPARNRVLTELFWLVKEKSKKQRVTAELLDLAEGYLMEYRDNFGEMTRYYEFKESIARARDDMQAAANALSLRAGLLKDNRSIYHDLVSEYGEELTDKQVQGYGYHLLHRNPYSTDALDSYLHKQLYWRGSPINALRAIEAAKEKGINYDVSYERRALNELGDTLKLYESYHIGAIDPGASKRYVNWFDNARNQALNGERKEIIYEFNDTNSEVHIVLPNGEVVTRQDHPVFGKVTNFKKGTSFISVQYNENGNLQSIKDSSGRVVELKYNATHNIERMTDGERVIEFIYNENSQPILISIVGLGRLYIEYDDNGEIYQTQSEQGHAMALNITQAFQRLLSLTRKVQSIHNLDDLPALAGSDIEYDRLKEDYFEAEEGAAKEIKAKMALVEYLVSHVTANSDYFNEANELLVAVFESRDSQSEVSIAYTARAISLWYELHKEFKPLGLPQDDFEQWAIMKTWLVGISFDSKKYQNILNKLNVVPLVLMKDAKWLVTSDIQNTGFWRRYDNSELYSGDLKRAQKQALLVRDNGDILLGTNKGLAVLKDGFWQWFGYDANQARLSRTTSTASLDTASNVLSLAETEDGVLWIGSANGLFALDGDYQSILKRWRTKSDGLISPRINVLKASDRNVYVGTADGLVSLTYSDEKVTALDGVKGNILDIVIAGEADNKVPVILTEKSLLLLDDGDVVTIADRAVSIAYNESNNSLYWLTDGKLYTASIKAVDDSLDISDGEFIALKSDLLHSKQIHELNIWPVEGEGNTLVINTDLGINVFNEHYFQSMPLPFELGRGGHTVGPEKSTVSENGDIVVATSDGIYAYQPSNVQQYKIGRVYDTLVNESLGITYIATGSEILYIDHTAEDKEPKYFASVNAKYLRQDAQGNLITNDDSQILRFKKGEKTAQQLFSTIQNVEGDRWGNGSLNDIFVDSNQNIWAAAGSSVFRYKEGIEEPEEYNYFIDAEIFPSRSQMIYRVYEDLDGKIKVIASNERHLSHKGVDLSGGVLEWQGDSFINLDEHSKDWLGNKHWFVTGYTKINDNTAIVSTNRDFAREKNGRRESFSDLNDPTYKAMQEKSSMIWLGQKGARLGDSNTWLFPSAGGVTVYHEGQWFYPDRLNQLLPDDQALGQYGARTVHTISVDELDNIYVGTDIGLLVYESQGVASLLNDNHRGQVAFIDFDVAQQQEVRDVFLSRIKPDTEQGKLVRRYQQLQGEIADIESHLQPGSLETSEGKTSDNVASEPDSAVAERFKAQLKLRERSRQKLLANLEKNHYGLFQMLKMDPREIAAMHKKLDERQALIQYMPTKDKLLIQVVTNTGAVIRQVDVSKEVLEKMSLETAAILREQTLQIGVGTSDRGAKRTDASTLFNGIKVKGDSHINHLAWLYHHLMRPVENDLEGKDQVFITPVGALTYVPFSALIRQVTPNIEYAVERYNIGILPSMYHFNLVMHHSDSYSDGGLFIADPDGSLPGARQEVLAIADSFGEDQTVFQGEQASIDNIIEELDGSRVIHFATHGVLNTESPEDSYLLLANKYQLNVIDISMLDLEQTDLVVLSACESGIGNSGLEYATLARAFAHAKVPAVVASYWKVHDDATKELMTNFYAGLGVEDSDNFSAMSSAMKSMISSRTQFSHPAAWASFGVFGKP